MDGKEKWGIRAGQEARIYTEPSLINPVEWLTYDRE